MNKVTPKQQYLTIVQEKYLIKTVHHLEKNESNQQWRQF